MTQNKKKPVKIELVSDLFREQSQAEDYIRVRGNRTDPKEFKANPSATEEKVHPLSGVVKMRREVKGRAGKPVTVLFDFSDPNARHSSSLRALQTLLKEKLACGGTFDDEVYTIVLQVDDLQRVRVTLEKLGFNVKG